MGFPEGQRLSMHLGCCSTFGKRKKHSPTACFFLRFSKVSQHPACMDDAILHRKPFGIPSIHHYAPVNGFAPEMGISQTNGI